MGQVEVSGGPGDPGPPDIQQFLDRVTWSTGRLLVTGGRAWPEEWRLRTTLAIVARHAHERLREMPVVVHGDCPDGADAMARRWCEWYRVPQERHPAEWGKLGRRAGYLRDKHMVTLGADGCVAFLNPASRGGRLTADLAELDQIPTLRVHADYDRQPD